MMQLSAACRRRKLGYFQGTFCFNMLLFQNPNVQTKQWNLQTFVLKQNSSEGMGSNLTVLLAEHVTLTKIRESYSEFIMCVFFIGLFLNVFPFGLQRTYAFCAQKGFWRPTFPIDASFPTSWILPKIRLRSFQRWSWLLEQICKGISYVFFSQSQGLQNQCNKLCWLSFLGLFHPLKCPHQ